MRLSSVFLGGTIFRSLNYLPVHLCLSIRTRNYAAYSLCGMPGLSWFHLHFSLHIVLTRWGHGMATHSALLASCEWNPPAIGRFPSQIIGLIFSLLLAWASDAPATGSFNRWHLVPNRQHTGNDWYEVGISYRFLQTILAKRRLIFST